MLAVLEASRAGYEEAILLTEDGYVGDGSGENIFAVKDGVVYTPDLSASILPGITRDSVIQIARGSATVCTNLIRTDLYVADELFRRGRLRSDAGSVRGRSVDRPAVRVHAQAAAGLSRNGARGQ
jgi:branched-chain amino acid aminotransferase